MKVICIDARGTKRLHEGHVYTIVKEIPPHCPHASTTVELAEILPLPRSEYKYVCRVCSAWSPEHRPGIYNKRRFARMPDEEQDFDREVEELYTPSRLKETV